QADGRIIEHAAELHLQSPADLLLGLINHFLHKNIALIGISSVLDEATNLRIRQILSHLNAPVYFAKVHAEYARLITGYDIPQQLGIDRWLQVLAMTRQPAQYCIIGCGTALTIDLLDEYKHLGGYILPSLYLQRDSLTQGTKGIKIPDQAFKSLATGRNTSDAVHHGILMGLLGEKSVRQATINIRYSALQHNFHRVKQLAPQSKIVCMVKANAYGIAHAVQAFADADAFGVACLQEALEIRQLGSKKPITLIEGVFSADEMPIVINEKLECIVHRQQQLDWLLQHKTAYQQAGLKVWVKLNSGMNRLGFKMPEIIDVIHLLKNEGFHCVLAMHFANADVPDHPVNQQQIEQLFQVKNACMPIEISCCNSAAIFNWSELHFDYVRPGIMLYGASPFATRSVHDLDVQPVMQFSAAIIAINQIKKGEHVGYGSHFTATKDMKIAVVSIGYGDGYPRAFSKDNFVAIGKQLVPVIGRVSMDMITIDISHLDADVEIGTSVELWGDTRLIDDVADANGTIGYELLCRLTQRPKTHIL
ncbi:hypothetical protein GWI33_012052, partial [Rhynchophorus ferrugineus]